MLGFIANVLTLGCYGQAIYYENESRNESRKKSDALQELDELKRKRQRPSNDSYFHHQQEMMKDHHNNEILSLNEKHTKELKDRDEVEAYLQNEIVNFKAQVVEMHGAMILIHKENEEIKQLKKEKDHG